MGFPIKIADHYFGQLLTYSSLIYGSNAFSGIVPIHIAT
jgi:hypothetical protein